MDILALSGSLRKASYNTLAIKALKLMAPSDVDITIGSIRDLPLFNPDQEADEIPALDTLVRLLKQSDGLIISSPEYAHGVSGPMKNALDWLVSGTEFVDKPVMLINTSPRASHAQSALKEILVTMSANVIESACLSIPLLGRDLDVDGVINDIAIASVLKASLNEFYLAVNARKLIFE
ncbi:MAG: chromate reductase [Oceanicoccus sp.]|jgi:chromate reductase